ncbi:MAG: cell division protein FtsZ, partial [Maritimibacter sp.]|nr:cell division protein FtsZ [Maritimibacter sp.]
DTENEDRAIQTAEKAIANPLLNEISLKGAKGVLINITGGYDLTLFELDEAANRIREMVDPEANIIVGSTLDPNLDGFIRVSVVATGIDAATATQEMPVPRRRMSEPLHSPQDVEQKLEAEAPRAIAAAAAIETGHPMDDIAEEPNFWDGDIEEEIAGTRDNFFHGGDDDLPAPAYQPRASAPRHTAPTSAPGGGGDRAQVAQFVAPKAPQPGTPSAEALQRLKAAAARSNPVRAEQPLAQPQTAGDNRPRFGINSLINRMTGTQEVHSAPAAPRQQPPMHGARGRDDPEPDPEHERVEIPAFLRRQAN